MDVITVLVTMVLVLLVIGIHHESLILLTMVLRRVQLGRARVGCAVVGATVAHMIEAIVFAVGIYWLVISGVGEVPGIEDLRDTIYFSFVTYSSLGYGDLVPTGGIRLLAGVEAVTGMVLMAWTASFTYYEMQRYWRST